MADTRLVALGVIALLIISLFVLIHPQGQPQPEVVSTCPTNQFASQENADGSLTCSTSPNQFDRVGLVGWWPLDEGTGTSAYDMTPNLNTGTLTGGQTWLSGGNCPSGDCVKLNWGPGNQYLNLGSSASILLTGQFSIALWFKMTDLPTQSGRVLGEILSFQGGGCGASSLGVYVIYYGAMVGTRCGIADDVSTNTGVMKSGRTSMLTITHDASNNIKLGINGSYVATAGPITYVNAGPLYINNGANGGLNATYSHIREYNRALSATEVSALYAEGNGALPNPVYPESQSANTFVSDSKSCIRASLVTLQTGFKLNYTTHTSGRISVTMDFQITNPGNSGTSNYQLSYGTGNAPACAATATGTTGGNTYTLQNAVVAATSYDQQIIFAVNLTPNTTYWFDLQVSCNPGGAGNQWTYSNPEMVVTELS